MSDELNNRKDIQQFLYDISRLSFQDMDLKSFLRNIHVKISKLISAKNFFIALYDEKKDMYSFPYYVDEHDDIDPNEYENLDGSLTDYIRRTGKGEIITTEREREIFKSEFKVIGEYSPVWIGAPIIHPMTGRPMGVIALQDYENEDVYDEKDVITLEIIAANIGLFIERIENLDRLKEANIAKDKFFSIIAHDLRNPFQQLCSSSELLLEDFKEGRLDDAYELAKLINSSANKGYNLLLDLLKWSRAQMDSLQYNPKVFELNGLLKEVSSQFETYAKQKKIKLIMQSGGELQVFADEDMVNFVVRNLLSNAFKFTDREGTIEIRSMLRGDKVVVEISDSGIGIDDELMKNLYNITERKSRPGTQNEEGTGLGLVISKEFIEKNNGVITVDSTPNVGTTFTLTLPTKSK